MMRIHERYLCCLFFFFLLILFPPISTLFPYTTLFRSELNQDDARYGFRCCHLKNIWTAPLPPETELSRQMTTSTTSIDIMGLQAAYAICILTKNVITSCSVTMMLFLHLEVKPLMTLTTVLYLSCALISGHLAMMLMELTKRR